MNLSRMLFCPTAFILTLLLHAYQPNLLPRILPRLWVVSTTAFPRTSRTPIKLKSMFHAFLFGEIYERLSRAATDEHESILARARDIAGINVTLVDLQELRTLLEEEEKNAPMLDRFRSAVSFVNAIWLVAVFGLTVTFWPLLQLVGGSLVRNVSAFVLRNIVPVVIRMHRLGIWEIAAYVVAMLFVSQAARYIAVMGSGGPGAYVALTAACASMLCFCYTSSLYFPSVVASRTSSLHFPSVMASRREAGLRKLFSMLFYGFSFFVLSILAAVHDSQMLGFFAMWALFFVLGFIGESHGLKYVIGFESKEDLIRVLVSSALILILFVTARLTGSAKLVRRIRPFRLGVMVAGNVTLFLALLLRSSLFYWETERSGIFQKGNYLSAQGQMLLCLALAMIVGRVFKFAAMANTASTFGVLYCAEKLHELPWGDWYILGIFIGFAALYVIALILRSHPEYLFGIVDTSFFLISAPSIE